MAESVETLTQQIVHRVTDPFGLAILTGVAISSFWFFGTLVLAMDGVLPATITQSERAERGVSETSTLKMWEWASHRAKFHFGSAGVFSGAAFSVASVLRPDLRPILYGASLFAFSALPYTIIVLTPIRVDILKITRDASKHDGKAPEPKTVDELFSQWSKYYSVKILIAAVVWSLGTAALLLA